MGAAASTVLVGTELTAAPLPRAAVTAVCLVLWSFCTWLIPLLVVFTIRQRPRFQAAAWSVVFLAMLRHAARRVTCGTTAG